MGPLTGVRVVDMSQMISGPFAATWLADQGADVVKVEDRTGDPARTLGPRKGDMSAVFFSVNHGKRGLVADLKGGEGREAVWAEIEQADVLVQNFRPGVAERLGFGYEAVAARRPEIVYCSISGFGSTGPRATTRAYDGIVQALAGFAACQDGPSGEPELVRSYVCDKVTSLTAAQAITAALLARTRTGEGQHVEINMLDSALAFIWPEGMWNYAFMTDPPPASPEVSTGYRLWRTKDGHMALGALQQAEFVNMCRALGASEIADDPRFANVARRLAHRTELRDLLEMKVASWTTTELDARMAQEDAPGARVNSREDILSDPQVLHNGGFVEIEAHEIGRVRGPRHPARFSRTPVAPHFRPAPRLKARI